MLQPNYQVTQKAASFEWESEKKRFCSRIRIQCNEPYCCRSYGIRVLGKMLYRVYGKL